MVTPSIRNWPVQRVKVDESTQHQFRWKQCCRVGCEGRYNFVIIPQPPMNFFLIWILYVITTSFSDYSNPYGMHRRRAYRLSMTKTYLYNFDPLLPHFYIVKLGFTGVYIIFLISAQKIDCGYSLEPPRRGGSNEYPQSMFWAEIRKISEFFYLKIFSFWRWNFLYIWIGVFS